MPTPRIRGILVKIGPENLFYLSFSGGKVNPEPPVSVKMSGLTIPILAVDEEKETRSLLKLTLESEGYSCDTAGSAREAIGKLDRRPYSVVLTDIKLPGMSGLEFLELIRKRDDEVAVIVLTALDDIALSILALKAGAYDYITKPFRRADLLAGIEKALQKRALILENRDYRQNLERKVREQSRKLQVSLIRTIEYLARILEARDPETREHSLRVTEYSVRTAEEMGLFPGEIERIRTASALHDIGKLGLREEILNKEETLRREEVEHIQRHPLIAASILDPIEELEEIIRLIRHHHENFDGSGYPDGLAGEEIPLGARIIAVADAFDAITSSRPYRKARSEEFAVREIRNHAGRQFDPAVVEAFLRAMGYSRNGPGSEPAAAESLPRAGG